MMKTNMANASAAMNDDGFTGLSKDIGVTHTMMDDLDKYDGHGSTLAPLVGDLIKTSVERNHTPGMDKVFDGTPFTYVKDWNDDFGDVKNLVKMRMECKLLWDCAQPDPGVGLDCYSVLRNMALPEKKRLANIIISDFSRRLRKGSKLRNLLLSQPETDEDGHDAQDDDYLRIRVASAVTAKEVALADSEDEFASALRDWFIEIDGNIVGGIGSLGIDMPYSSLVLVTYNGVTSVKPDDGPTPVERGLDL